MAVNAQGANRLVEEQLTSGLRQLEKIWRADVLTYSGPIASGADDLIRDSIENLDGRHPKILVLLETYGGYAEVARRIAETLHHHYKTVDFLVPSHAMSAGTILVMSGHSILMDYYSVLGPIDPQVENKDGRTVPALGYLIRYEELLEKANKGTITTAEMGILMDFDQGELFSFEQARDLSRSLLIEWLVKYKFKNWKRTERHRKKVTPAMKKQCAKEIAEKLDNVRKWNSHGIGISMKLLSREVGLKIDDFGKKRELSRIVRRYHRLLTDYMGKMGHMAALHTRDECQLLIKGTS